MFGFLVLEQDPTSKMGFKLTQFPAQEDACKYVLGQKQAILFQAIVDPVFDEENMQMTWTFLPKSALDPVIVQPPTPPPFTDYPIDDVK